MRKWPIVGVVLLGGGLAVYYGTGSFSAKPATSRPPAPRVPVSAVTVAPSDVPIYLDGIGTVQAFNSVVVKSRVDGQIVKLNYSEGKDVHAGDVLVEIDPRPFRAALEQAQANKLKDEAHLTNARLDLARAGQLDAVGHGSKQQLDTAQALVSQLEATIKADQAMIDMAQTQLGYSRVASRSTVGPERGSSMPAISCGLRIMAASSRSISCTRSSSISPCRRIRCRRSAPG